MTVLNLSPRSSRTGNLFEDRNVEFQVNLLPSLEPSAVDRVFTFELVTEAQGAEISRLTVELTVPAD